MNRLHKETSPYLLQHKNNPVDWYPWGKEAIEIANKEDKPILVSIGYSACHWCHVMEKESFENEKIAKFMNENFINVKIDREERPDIDSIYMNFVQMTTGSGGWPLTVFLTPDLIPFFGGTYFPPEDKYNRTGFPKILSAVSNAYQTKKEDIKSQQNDILKALRDSLTFNKQYNEFTSVDFKNIFEEIERTYDKNWGGFGSAPKFPSTMAHLFLLRHYFSIHENNAIEMVLNSLNKMAAGGIYDQLGGGFHRYSTDGEWLVPHFEKMLYDNALLSRLYLEAYQVTKDEFYLKIAEDTLKYVMREMTDESGGFYSAQDADSEGEEGKFFVWQFDEIKNLLTDDEFELAQKYFGITKSGNFENKNILTSVKDLKEISSEFELDEKEIESKIESIKEKLFKERSNRIKPALDDKILTSWNSLMLYSFTLAFTITGNDAFRNIALKNADFIKEKCIKDGKLYHSFKNGELKYEGYLDNYAFTCESFIFLFEVTGETKWLNTASDLAVKMINGFYDDTEKNFYFTSKNEKDIIVRSKDIYDNATPSGNSSAAIVLKKLSYYLNNDEYDKKAYRLITNLHGYQIKYPLSFSYLICASYFYFNQPEEIVFIYKTEQEKNDFLNRYYSEFLPFNFLSHKKFDDKSELELFKDKDLVEGKSAIYICQDYVCKEPVTDFNQAIKILKHN